MAAGNGAVADHLPLAWVRAEQSIDVRPDPAGWAKAATLPIMVVVGSLDTEPQKPRTGHTGNTRVQYAQQWVAEMNGYARSRRAKGMWA